MERETLCEFTIYNNCCAYLARTGKTDLPSEAEVDDQLDYTLYWCRAVRKVADVDFGFPQVRERIVASQNECNRYAMSP